MATRTAIPVATQPGRSRWRAGNFENFAACRCPAIHFSAPASPTSCAVWNRSGPDPFPDKSLIHAVQNRRRSWLQIDLVAQGPSTRIAVRTLSFALAVKRPVPRHHFIASTQPRLKMSLRASASAPLQHLWGHVLVRSQLVCLCSVNGFPGELSAASDRVGDEGCVHLSLSLFEHRRRTLLARSPSASHPLDVSITFAWLQISVQDACTDAPSPMLPRFALRTAAPV